MSNADGSLELAIMKGRNEGVQGGVLLSVAEVCLLTMWMVRLELHSQQR